MSKLLIVDDEESICWGLAKVVKGLGHTPITKSSAEAALQLRSDERPSAIVLDVRLPGVSGLEAMSQLRERFGSVPIIVITAHGDLQTAVDSVRNGAFEYVVKPFEIEEIRELILKAIEAKSMSDAAEEDAETHQVLAIDGMSGRSRVMQNVFTRIALAATSDAGVMILGESGTGKELAARAVHRYSDRANGPFIPVNIAALNPSLAESALFGHVRGAYTGAEADREGLLKQADGGTFFIDEVGDIPTEMQVKLLRALEHGVFKAVGSGESMKSDFRVISATNRDLARSISTGEFRDDLYYRLASFLIEMPPLRDRGDDIILLAQQFAHLLGSSAQSFTQEAERALLNRPWRGNVRELRNAIEHAMILSRGSPIEPRHLPAILLLPNSGVSESLEDLPTAIREWITNRLAAGDDASQIKSAIDEMVEQPLISGTLARHRGNYSAAAKDLGIHRTTLRRKVADEVARASED